MSNLRMFSGRATSARVDFYSNAAVEEAAWEASTEDILAALASDPFGWRASILRAELHARGVKIEPKPDDA